jgi:hypothetical protein
MEIQRVYEKIINISASEMYCKDLDALILEKLRQKYNNRCENFTYIKDIKSIVRRSMLQLTKDQLDGSGTVSVMFSADAVVYEEGTIMVGCKILDIDRANLITCEYQNSLIYIKANHNLSFLKKNDKIICKVLRAGYAKEQKIVSINAQMYFCPKEFIIFAIKTPIGSLTNEQAELVNKKLEEIKAQEDNTTRKQKMWAYFSKLFFPFKETYSGKLKKLDLIKTAKQIADKKFNDASNKYMCLTRHPMVEKSEPLIYQIEYESLAEVITGKSESVQKTIMHDSSKMGDLQIVARDLFSALMELLHDYYTYIRMINEILKVYDDEEITRNKSLWTAYEHLKI